MVTASAFGVRADESTLRVSIEYSASSGCPPVGDFSAQLMARSARIRPVAPGEHASTRLGVSLLSETSETVGRLVMRDDQGALSEREVRGESCAEVASALALVTALALDPKASSGDISSPAPTAPSGAPPVAAPRGGSAEVVRPRIERTRDEPTTTHFALGADAAIRIGATPDPVLVVPLFIEAEIADWEPFWPLFRLGFERSASDLIDLQRGKAAFRWTAGSAEACAVIAASRLIRPASCLRVEAGMLEGKGTEIADARSERRPWFALGATGLVEWSFLEPAFADAGAGFVFPLTRDRFYFEPNSTIYRPAPVGFLLRIGLGVRFP